MNIAQQGLKFAACGGSDVDDRLDRGGHEGLDLGKFPQLDPFRALRKDEQALVGHFDDFMDGRQGADGVQIAGLGGIDAGVALGDNDDRLFLAK